MAAKCNRSGHWLCDRCDSPANLHSGRISHFDRLDGTRTRWVFIAESHVRPAVYDFAFGVAFDDSVDSDSPVITEPDGSRRYATCPNCGQINIDVSGVPNSHGDQLLVQKHVYDFRPPQRWEVIVFRNPASPGEAYVKRVTGLPGDRIQIVNGDVFINGQIARKNFKQQLAMRIPVCNLHYLASSEDWQLPWELDDGWAADNGLLVTAEQRTESTANQTAGDIAGTATTPGRRKLNGFVFATGDGLVVIILLKHR